jgi:hypothetical protein
MMLEPERSRPTIVERAKNILIQPKAEWERIDAEPSSVGDIFRGYVLILAAIPAIATLIGQAVFGMSFGPFSYKPPIGTLLAMTVISYSLSVAGVFVLSLIIDALAPTFKGTRSKVQAAKVAAYSYTAAWVAGIFGLLPQLSFVAILIGGLYSLYLLYLGLPRLMKVAEEKAIPYVVSVVVAAIVLSFIAGLLLAAVMSSFYSIRPPVSSVAGTVEVPGVGKVDLEELDAATKQMEATAKRMEEAAEKASAEMNASLEQ